MKKIMIGITLLMLLFFAGSAVGYSVTYQDPDTQKGAAANWPGYYSPPTLGYNYDFIGSPMVQSMTITVNDTTKNLETVSLYMHKRYIFDSLFINTKSIGATYQNWNYYVKDTNINNTGATLYDVSSAYTYSYTPAGYERKGHPSGIATGITPDTFGILQSVIWSGGFTDATDLWGTLTYTFNQGIVMGPDFTIGYSEWCANDVVLGQTHVPEPGTMLLLGMGLLGVALVRRKK